jgi:hypothetical protein
MATPVLQLKVTPQLQQLLEEAAASKVISQARVAVRQLPLARMWELRVSQIQLVDLQEDRDAAASHSGRGEVPWEVLKRVSQALR